MTLMVVMGFPFQSESSLVNQTVPKGYFAGRRVGVVSVEKGINSISVRDNRDISRINLLSHNRPTMK